MDIDEKPGYLSIWANTKTSERCYIHAVLEERDCVQYRSTSGLKEMPRRRFLKDFVLVGCIKIENHLDANRYASYLENAVFILKAIYAEKVQRQMNDANIVKNFLEGAAMQWDSAAGEITIEPQAGVFPAGGTMRASDIEKLERLKDVYEFRRADWYKVHCKSGPEDRAYNSARAVYSAALRDAAPKLIAEARRSNQHDVSKVLTAEELQERVSACHTTSTDAASHQRDNPAETKVDREEESADPVQEGHREAEPSESSAHQPDWSRAQEGEQDRPAQVQDDDDGF